MLKDEGVPFNTSVTLVGSKAIGLTMAQHLRKSIEYSYSFDRNMTVLKWALNDTIN